MRAADCCVFPFHRIENSGSVILAMGFGLPVIVPNTPVMREKVSSTGGFLFEHPDELPSLMEKASSMNSDELSQMGNRNLAYAQGLNWSDFGKLFQE
jgi:glycosyltransferase involved in cell wall biosynthesis